MKDKKDKLKEWLNSDNLLKRSFSIWIHGFIIKAIITAIAIVAILIWAMI